MRMFQWLRRGFSRRDGGVILFLVLFTTVTFLTRVALLIKAWNVVTFDSSLFGAFVIGFVYDLGAALLFALPVTVLLIALPANFFQRRWAQCAAYAGFIFAFYLLLFGAVSEWLFWDEFGVRFNFSAVDYLVYTQEVVKKIQAS